MKLVHSLQDSQALSILQSREMLTSLDRLFLRAMLL